MTLLIPTLRETPGIAEDGALAQSGKVYTDEIRQLFREFRDAENELAAAASRMAGRRTEIAVIVGVVAVGASTTLIILFGIVLSQSIGRPVRAVASGASRLAAGELDHRLPEHGPGEIGDLTHAFNAMAERLEEGRAGAAGSRTTSSARASG